VIWVLILLCAVGIALAAMLLFRVPRAQWTVLGAAMALGLAGYAWQGRPDLPGAPKAGAEAKAADGSAMVAIRRSFADGMPSSDFLIISDGFARRGDFANAAGILRGATRKNPQDGQAWLAMANALVERADGQLTPASLYAYRKAAAANPQDAAPPFFLGVAMIRGGRLIEADQLWRESLSKTPADAPWRKDLEQRLGALEGLMRRIAGQ